MKDKELLQEWLMLYSEYLGYNDYQPSTRTAYVSQVESCLEFVDSFDKYCVMNYLLHFKENYSNSYYNLALSALKLFTKYLAVNQQIDSDWLADKATIKVVPKPVEALNRNELSKLLAYCHVSTDVVDGLCILLMLNGLRKQELLDLDKYHVQWTKRGGAIRVRNGKGGIDRSVPMTKSLMTFLHKKVATTGSSLQLLPIPLSYDSIGYLVKRVCRDAKIGRKVYPHILRHTYATKLSQSGIPIETISNLLGHSDIRTTMRYINPTSDEIAETLAEKSDL